MRNRIIASIIIITFILTQCGIVPVFAGARPENLRPVETTKGDGRAVGMKAELQSANAASVGNNHPLDFIVPPSVVKEHSLQAAENKMLARVEINRRQARIRNVIIGIMLSAVSLAAVNSGSISRFLQRQNVPSAVEQTPSNTPPEPISTPVTISLEDPNRAFKRIEALPYASSGKPEKMDAAFVIGEMRPERAPRVPARFLLVLKVPDSYQKGSIFIVKVLDEPGNKPRNVNSVSFKGAYLVRGGKPTGDAIAIKIEETNMPGRVLKGSLLSLPVVLDVENSGKGFSFSVKTEMLTSPVEPENPLPPLIRPNEPYVLASNAEVVKAGSVGAKKATQDVLRSITSMRRDGYSGITGKTIFQVGGYIRNAIKGLEGKIVYKIINIDDDTIYTKSFGRNYIFNAERLKERNSGWLYRVLSQKAYSGFTVASANPDSRQGISARAAGNASGELAAAIGAPANAAAAGWVALTTTFITEYEELAIGCNVDGMPAMDGVHHAVVSEDADSAIRALEQVLTELSTILGEREFSVVDRRSISILKKLVQSQIDYIRRSMERDADFAKRRAAIQTEYEADVAAIYAKEAEREQQRQVAAYHAKELAQKALVVGKAIIDRDAAIRAGQQQSGQKQTGLLGGGLPFRIRDGYRYNLLALELRKYFGADAKRPLLGRASYDTTRAQLAALIREGGFNPENNDHMKFILHAFVGFPLPTAPVSTELIAAEAPAGRGTEPEAANPLGGTGTELEAAEPPDGTVRAAGVGAELGQGAAAGQPMTIEEMRREINDSLRFSHGGNFDITIIHNDGYRSTHNGVPAKTQCLVQRDRIDASGFSYLQLLRGRPVNNVMRRVDYVNLDFVGLDNRADEWLAARQVKPAQQQPLVEPIGDIQTSGPIGPLVELGKQAEELSLPSKRRMNIKVFYEGREYLVIYEKGATRVTTKEGVPVDFATTIAITSMPQIETTLQALKNLKAGDSNADAAGQPARAAGGVIVAASAVEALERVKRILAEESDNLITVGRLKKLILAAALISSNTGLSRGLKRRSYLNILKLPGDVHLVGWERVFGKIVNAEPPYNNFWVSANRSLFDHIVNEAFPAGRNRYKLRYDDYMFLLDRIFAANGTVAAYTSAAGAASQAQGAAAVGVVPTSSVLLITDNQFSSQIETLINGYREQGRNVVVVNLSAEDSLSAVTNNAQLVREALNSHFDIVATYLISQANIVNIGPLFGLKGITPQALVNEKDVVDLLNSV